MDEDFVFVGFFDETGDLHTLKIARDACTVARARGWMIFDDFERQMLADVPVQSSPARVKRGRKDDRDREDEWTKAGQNSPHI